MMVPLLSLCIPTNGVEEWVLPVIDSIYKQRIDESLYEVIITDNGSNLSFQKKIVSIARTHKNLFYFHTSAKMFLNQIEAFRMAHGEFIKFVNHRMVLEDESINYLLNTVKENLEEKPIIYFSNGMLKQDGIKQCDSFDEYIYYLSFWSSWSAGLAIWKEDFEKCKDIENYNELFPHMTILTYDFGKKNYIVDDHTIMHDIPFNNTKKGKYNLFYAFGAEYPAILLDLLRADRITVNTFLKVKRDLLGFLADQYINYIIIKRECSYDLSNYMNYIEMFYSKRQIKKATLERLLYRSVHKFAKK